MSLVRNNGKKNCRCWLRSPQLCALVAMTVAMGAAPAFAQCVEQQKLTVSDSGYGDAFGISVSVSGDTAVVGADSDDCAAGAYCGAAYVFRLNGTAWIEEQTLTSSDAAANDYFGYSVSVSGDVAVVGADGDDCAAGLSCGAAYVFRFNGTAWVEEQKMTASVAAANDDFGRSVSVNGDTAVVGAKGVDCAAGGGCGAAYVFRYDPSETTCGQKWCEEQKLTASDAAEVDQFGFSVSVSGDTALVGTPADDCAAGSVCGSAYVFRFNGTAWVEEQKLTASDAEAWDTFGVSVSITGDTAVVGAWEEDYMGGPAYGSAYVYRFNGTSWVEEQKLTASDAAADDLFGVSVSVSGDTTVVGVYNDDCAAGVDCGSARVFRFNGTSWVEEQTLTASDAAAEDMFGVSVSISGDTVAVGAFGDNCWASSYCGSAYMFHCLAPGTVPAVPTWGIVLMGLLMLTAATLVYMERQRRAA